MFFLLFFGVVFVTPFNAPPPSSWHHCYFFDATPLSSRCCCFFQCSSSFLAWLFLLLLDIIAIPVSLTLFFFLFDIIIDFWWCSSSYFSSTLFLFLLDIVFPLAAPQWYSCFSLTPFLLLLLLDTILVPFIASTFLFPLNVVVFSLNVFVIPLVLDWYFPPSCFYNYERSKLSKFDLPSSNHIWRWICFFFPNNCLLMTLFLVLIVYVYFG